MVARSKPGKPFESRSPRYLGLPFVVLCVATTNAMLVQRERFHGVWKLVTDCLPYERDIRSRLLGLLENDKENDQEFLLKLNPDGTFKQCNENYKEGKWISGNWELKEGKQQQLLLAFNRQYFGPRCDLMLQGESVSSDGQLAVDGNVQMGKFMYPAKHPRFFEATLVNKELLGQFTMQQVISTRSIMGRTTESEETNSENRFHESTFHGQSFILTLEPLIWKKSKARGDLNVPVDVLSMPLHFYHNNTFQALGANKILRGRFQLTETNILSFEVSLFGAGRSNPGSVWSEGHGLSHDDERSYRGVVKTTNGRLHVEGVVMFGTDMGSDARPEPCGKFILTQVDDNCHDLDEGDDLLGSIFE
eukprot:scaffold22850_cov179-Cylindrotheca_fusiformis.AAC.2